MKLAIDMWEWFWSLVFALIVGGSMHIMGLPTFFAILVVIAIALALKTQWANHHAGRARRY